MGNAQDGGEDLYKIGKNAPLKKLMAAYCVKKNLDLRTVRFIFKKKGLKPQHTPSQVFFSLISLWPIPIFTF